MFDAGARLIPLALKMPTSSPARPRRAVSQASFSARTHPQRTQGYASGVHSPAALLAEHFEQPPSPRIQNLVKERNPAPDSGFASEEKRSIQAGDGDSDEFDRQQQSAHNGVRGRGR